MIQRAADLQAGLAAPVVAGQLQEDRPGRARDRDEGDHSDQDEAWPPRSL